MPKQAHITINGRPFCDWTGCQAGRDKQVAAAKALDVSPVEVSCGHRSMNHARKIAAALRPLFRRGAVAVIAGECPEREALTQ